MFSYISYQTHLLLLLVIKNNIVKTKLKILYLLKMKNEFKRIIMDILLVILNII